MRLLCHLKDYGNKKIKHNKLSCLYYNDRFNSLENSCDICDIFGWQKLPYNLFNIFYIKSYGNKLFNLIFKTRALS